jgi:hypothetical protein
MTHKTFISYKYSEAQELRDNIIDVLGEGASYYQGETSDSPDLTDYTTETIREHLKDMIFGTTVTIVIISPHMTESEWIDWEIEYSLREYSRNGKKSKSNGVVGVVMKVDGGYDWLRSTTTHADGHTSTNNDTSKMYKIINDNRFNENPKIYVCSKCKTVDRLSGSYISLIPEEEFLDDPNFFIENAYQKCQSVDKYIISKTR